MSSLLVRNATLPDGRTGLDILCADGRIANLAPRISASAERTIDAGGMLVAPPFVDAHFHMDSTLTYGKPRVNASGTLLEGIALWGELKPALTQEAIVERAPDDRVVRERGFQLAPQRDALEQRPARVHARHAERERRIHVEVGVHERR